MASDCQACVAGIGSIPQPALQSNRNDPLGACWDCSSFACAHHGQRDGTKAQFWCVECDRQLLVASASGTGQSGATQAARQSIHAGEMMFDYLRFESMEDVGRRRPAYRQQLIPEVERWRLDTNDIRRVDPDLADAIESLSPRMDAYRFLVLAGLIGLRLEIREDRMPEYLWHIQKSLREVGGGR